MKALIVILLVCVIALGSLAVYQQSQLSALSRSVSQLSSELVHPTVGLSLSNFTVTKTNATSSPLFVLVMHNNGTAPASSGHLLVLVYGRDNSIRSCYNGSTNFFPLYSNWSIMVYGSLDCGQLGDVVAVTVQADFLTSSGSFTKTLVARAGISQSQVIPVSTVVVNQVRIRTWVLPAVLGGGEQYEWYLTVTNEGSAPIVGVHATLSSGNDNVAEASGCDFLSGNVYPVSSTNPLIPGTSCSNGGSLRQGVGPFTLGQRLDVVVTTTYSNGTSIDASTVAVVEPLYAIFQTPS